MAAQEYYSGFRNNAGHNQAPAQSGYPPPQYQSYLQAPPQAPQQYNQPYNQPYPQQGPPQMQQPYPQSYPQSYHQHPQAYAPPSPPRLHTSHSHSSSLRPQRSHSEPPSPRHHHHHHHHHASNSPRPKARGKDSNTSNTFLGTFAGGAIGDAIFPGLGTLGGALLGGWGGHEVGKDAKGRRRGKSTGRVKDTYDQEWEAGKKRRGEWRD